jgi:hypothetical protein
VRAEPCPSPRDATTVPLSPTSPSASTTPSTSVSSLRLVASISGAEGLIVRRWAAAFTNLGSLPDHSVGLYHSVAADDLSLYQLLQLARGSAASITLWLGKISAHILGLGYTASQLDPGVFHMASSSLAVGQTVIVWIHDDCVCAAASHDSLLRLFDASVTACGYVSKMSPVTSLLDIDIDTTPPDGIFLSQKTYISSIVAAHRHALSAYPAKSPATPADEHPATGLAAHVTEALDTYAASPSPHDRTRPASSPSSHRWLTALWARAWT